MAVLDKVLVTKHLNKVVRDSSFNLKKTFLKYNTILSQVSVETVEEETYRLHQ